jgi:fructokinase
MAVVCFGELIIDFTSMEAGKELWQAERFQKNVGGAPANVAIGLHYHGVPVELWSKVGNDSFGKFLIDQIDRFGISTQNIIQDSRHPTKLAFVGVEKDGERYFEFHNLNSAERYMNIEDFDLRMLNDPDFSVFHFGGVALLGDVTSNTLIQILKIVKKNNTLVSFDPNIRVDLLPDKDAVLNRLKNALAYVDILKLSEEDRLHLFSEKSGRDLFCENISLLILTEGVKGVRLLTEKEDVFVTAEDVTVVDTTGAGDAFTAAFLSRLIHASVDVPEDISSNQLNEWGKFANRWAAKIIQFPGAVTGYFR